MRNDSQTYSLPGKAGKREPYAVMIPILIRLAPQERSTNPQAAVQDEEASGHGATTLAR
jgi:hypothetical protein